MTIVDSIILGLTQGVSEFLPISSSGHLVIIEKVLGLKIEELKSFDVSLHMATLLAILIYFRAEVVGMIGAFFKFFLRKLEPGDKYAKLIPLLIVGTIPAVLLGYFAGDYLDAKFRNSTSIAILLISVGLFFVFAEWRNKQVVRKEKMGVGGALMIGIAQSMALIPGVSRSGGTISTGLLLGFERSEMAKFSFLLGIPAMAGAGLLTFLDMTPSEMANIDYRDMIFGFIAAFTSGILCISFLMKFLRKHTLNIFAGYRILLGVGILIFL